MRAPGTLDVLGSKVITLLLSSLLDLQKVSSIIVVGLEQGTIHQQAARPYKRCMQGLWGWLPSSSKFVLPYSPKYGLEMRYDGQSKLTKGTLEAKEQNNQLGEHDRYVMLHNSKQSSSRAQRWRIGKVGVWTTVQTLSDYDRSYPVSSRIGALG